MYSLACCVGTEWLSTTLVVATAQRHSSDDPQENVILGATIVAVCALMAVVGCFACYWANRG